MITPSFWRLCLLGTGVFLFSSCTLPQASYRKVDQGSPAFKQAVALETEKLQARGQSASDAEESATKVVTKRLIQEEKTKRTKEVTPLVEILSALEKPRGCWAYTATTATRKEGKESVKVERYDPFQPEERLWTLVTLDGKTPDETEQASYRERRLRAWKKTLTKADPKRARSEQLKRKALFSDLEITASSSEETAQTTYTFSRDRISVPLFGDLPPSRETYVARDDVLARQTLAYLGPASLLAGGLKIAHFASETDYIVVEPALPPFVAKTTVHLRATLFGKDTGELEEETVYTDYRRVKCYDDRFEIKIGAPNLINFVPSISER